MTPAQQRAQAARTVAAVMRGRSLDDALPPDSGGFVRALAYGVLREQRLLAHFCSRLLQQPVTAEVQALLLCGLQQLRSMDVAAHAAVNETVAACEELGQPRARGLVNAVLRRWQREAAELERGLPEDAALRLSHPDWLMQRLRADWPGSWAEIAAHNNLQAPLVLRVNRRAGNRDRYLERLRAAGIAAEAVPGTTEGVVLGEARGVDGIPGFADGAVSVQDAAAQRAADLLELTDGQRVLDACAAPGGKTAHLLERHELELVAVDQDAARQQRTAANLQRLRLHARLVTADAAATDAWWDGKPFDRILLDAPCSGSGVIRRHPDIKWLRRASDLPRLAQRQGRLLAALWPLLRPGGILLYATCSVLDAEGDAVIGGFLGSCNDARALPAEPGCGEVATRYGQRIAPQGPRDGFYYCRLVRTAA